jgi:hypothetical protein
MTTKAATQNKQQPRVKEMTWDEMDRLIDRQVKRDSKLLKVLAKL